VTVELWKQALVKFVEHVSPSERLMAQMLIDLSILPTAQPIFDGWALRVLP
jgi:hypothetical protein